MMRSSVASSKKSDKEPGQQVNDDADAKKIKETEVERKQKVARMIFTSLFKLVTRYGLRYRLSNSSRTP